MVLFRIDNEATAKKIIQEAHRNGVLVVYSVDDLLFGSKEITPHTPCGLDFSKSYSTFYLEKTQRICAIINKCDAFIGSTNYLCQQAKRFGIHVFMIKNGLNNRQIEESRKALQVVRKSEKIIISYFSGTHTHDVDFYEAQNALLKILDEFLLVELRIIGFLEIGDPRFNKHTKRIKRLPFINWKKLPYEIVKADINIAPLEIGNPFVEAKSELKYFEAGVVKVPTIASASGVYVSIITNGLNGFLANTENDWYTYLKLLVESKDLRGAIGASAHEHVMRHYCPHVLKKETCAVFGHIFNLNVDERSGGT